MPERIIIPTNIYKKLLEHISDVEKNKIEIINEWSLKTGSISEPLESTLNKYIDNIWSFLKTKDLKRSSDCHISAEASDHIPFVIIGSLVEIMDLRTKEIFKYKLVHPFQSIPGDIDCISYISPLGKSLILKNINDEFETQTPGGVYNYKILSILM